MATGRDVLEGAAAQQGRAPDAGLAAISAEFAAGAQAGPLRAFAGAAGSAGTPGGGPGDGRQMPRFYPEDAWTLRLPPQSVVAANTADPVDWGPPTGRAWRLDSVVVQLAGASQVSFYREAVAAVNLAFQTSTSGVWEPHHELMIPGERLLIVFTGGGGTVSARGRQYSLATLPDHIV